MFVVKASYDDETILPGTVIKDFRGDEATFLGIDQIPTPGKTGKIAVMVQGTRQVFYPSVFGLFIVGC